MFPLTTNTTLIFAIFLFLLLDFLKEPGLLKNRTYFITGIISNIAFLIFLVIFINNGQRLWIYLSFCIAAMSGLTFQFFKYSLTVKFNLLKSIPLIIAFLLTTYAIIIILTWVSKIDYFMCDSPWSNETKKKQIVIALSNLFLQLYIGINNNLISTV